MRSLGLLLPAVALLAGPPASAPGTPGPTGGATGTARDATATSFAAPGATAAKRGTTISVRSSRYGTMLFGPRRQAIYIFGRDRRNRSNCYGQCAALWPPVYAKGTPVAGRGVRRSLLGTTRRRDGRRQVTYRGQPLYYYANEGPGQVRCHNVFLNGGLWWVVGPDGKRRP